MAEQKQKKSGLQIFMMQLVSGGGAGATSKTCVAPLERIKVLLQVQHMAKVPEDQKYKGIIDALVRIPKEQGVLAFWRGNGTNVIRIIPNAAIKFTCYDTFKAISMPKGEKNYTGFNLVSRKLASGGLSGATTLALTYPMDLARTRLTADMAKKGESKLYNGMMDCIVKTAKQEGPAALFKGILISMAGIVPYLALAFSGYDTLKLMMPKDEKSMASWWYPWAKLLVGSTAGVFAQSVTYPLDTIRRRMQMNGGAGQDSKYTSTMHCIKHMYTNEGVSSFYKGLFANAIKTAPGAAIQFVAYDYIKLFLIGKEQAKV